MLSFSDDTTWVHADDQADPLHMRIPIVLKLAVIHYYAVRTFSYISLPTDTFEGQLIDYGLVYIANTDVHYSRQYPVDDGVCEPCRSVVQLALTSQGQAFLRKVPKAKLVAELINHQFSPDRSWRWYPYEIPIDNVYCTAEWYMECLGTQELPQFLSHEVSTIREKAHELLMVVESTCIINET